MKVTTERVTPVTFVPIKLSLTFDTLEEAEQIGALFNLSPICDYIRLLKKPHAPDICLDVRTQLAFHGVTFISSTENLRKFIESYYRK